MARKLMQFTRIEQKMPEKRTAQTRAKDFGEIYAGFAPEQAATQASRCSGLSSRMVAPASSTA